MGAPFFASAHLWISLVKTVRLSGVNPWSVELSVGAKDAAATTAEKSAERSLSLPMVIFDLDGLVTKNVLKAQKDELLVKTDSSVRQNANKRVSIKSEISSSDNNSNSGNAQ